MTYAKMFKYATWQQIVDMFAKNKSRVTLAPLERFMKRHHYLSMEIINGMIFYVIFANKGNLPLKESYYRITQEDWRDNKIDSLEIMLEYFNESLEIRKQQNEQKELKKQATQKAINKYNQEQSDLVKETVIDPNTELQLDRIFDKMR